MKLFERGCYKLCSLHWGNFHLNSRQGNVRANVPNSYGVIILAVPEFDEFALT